MPQSSNFERACTHQKMETWRRIMTVHFSKKVYIIFMSHISLFELESNANTNVEHVDKVYWWGFVWNPGTTEIS